MASYTVLSPTGRQRCRGVEIRSSLRLRLLVLLALFMALLVSTPVAARAESTWDRLWGENAYGTMQAVVRAGNAFPDGSGGTVVVATGDGYWDALAASGLAGRLGAPVLITQSSRLTEQTKAEIARIKPARILVMGGKLAVSDGVVSQLQGLCKDVQRVWGQDAAGTAAAIFKRGSGWSKTAIVATSDGYWDALSIAPYAYSAGAPIFLTQSSPDSNQRVLSRASLDALKSGGFKEVIIVGGNLAVSSQVEAQIKSVGATPTRLWGENALDTSGQIARWEVGRGMKLEGMGVATGNGYWDALTGASLCGKLGSIVVLSNPGNYTAIDSAFSFGRPSHGYVFGGTLAIPASTYNYLVTGHSAGTASGPLHVSGSHLVDGKGNPVQLRGISTHGLAWYPVYVNATCFRELHDTWNANVVRLALYTEEYGGYCSGGDRTQLLNLVRSGIRYATDAGMYVIVDWHILSDGNPLTHLADAKAFFATISSEFGGQGNVIYEICNEPNGGTSWDDIRRYANEVIPVIRSNDPSSVVVVGTPTWSQEVDKALANPLDFDNVMYALHFYAATHRDDLRSRMVSCSQAGLPIFVTEFGICDASGNGQIDEASADQWVATMNSLDISYCMWSLSNKAESASAIASSCTKASGFSQADLAQSGRWLYRTLTSDKSYAKLPADGGSGGGSGGTGGGGSSPSTGETRSFDQGSFSISTTLVNSWPNGSSTSYQYEVSITNKSGSGVGSWQVSIPFSQGISFDGNGWNANCSASGSSMTLSNKDYNGSIPAGGSATGIGFIISSGAGLHVS